MVLLPCEVIIVGLIDLIFLHIAISDVKWCQRLWLDPRNWRYINHVIIIVIIIIIVICVCAGGVSSVLQTGRADIVVSVFDVVTYSDEVWNATLCRHLRQTCVGLWSLLRGPQGQTLPSHHQTDSYWSLLLCWININIVLWKVVGLSWLKMDGLRARPAFKRSFPLQSKQNNAIVGRNKRKGVRKELHKTKRVRDHCRRKFSRMIFAGSSEFATWHTDVSRLNNIIARIAHYCNV